MTAPRSWLARPAWSNGMGMRAGFEDAIRAAGGVGALARSLGISQPAVSGWSRVPADRVIAVEAATGVPRSALRPDLYPDDAAPASPAEGVDETDLLRSHHYGLLALLLGRAPTAEVLNRVARLEGDGSVLGTACAALAAAARDTGADAASREFFDLFIGVGRGELLPYASYYLTGFLNERPLARVRGALAELGVERADGSREPEDHIATLLDTMSGLASGRFAAPVGGEEKFFERNLQPWAERFFSDLEGARQARFYRTVGALGRLFIEIETEAFAIDG